MKKVALLIGLAYLVGAEDSQRPSDWQRARALYYKGLAGDTAAYRSADELFTRLYRENRAAPLQATVAFASSKLVKPGHCGRRIVCPKKVFDFWTKPCATAGKSGDSFCASCHQLSLARHFHRRQHAKDDFASIARHAAAAAHTGRLEPALASASLYFDGEFLDEAGCEDLAVADWKNATTLAPDSPAAKGAREKLKQVER